MPDPVAANRPPRLPANVTGVSVPADRRRVSSRRSWLVGLGGLVALGLALQVLAGWAGPNSVWSTAGPGPQASSEALELDDDEPQLSLSLSPISILPLQLASAPVPPQLTSVTLTPLTPPPPSA